MKMISKILAGQLYDPHLRQLVPNQLITVCRATGVVVRVETFTAADAQVALRDDPETIDLRHLTLCPGFVDAHVHCASLAT